MNYSVAICTDERKVVYVRLMSLGESLNWLGVMTLDDAVPTITIVDDKVEAADLTNQFIPLRRLIGLTLNHRAVSLSGKVLSSQETTLCAFGG